MHATVTSLCWGVVVVTWIAGAVENSRNAHVQQRASGTGALWRLAIAGVSAAIYLFARHDLHRIATHSAWLEIPGLALLVASMIFTLWARSALGRMWSFSPDVLQDHHQLRTTGPYGITRHPIYTGLSGMLLGTALFNGLGTWVVLLLIAVALCATRVPIEERLMSATFPEEYAGYRRRVPQLIPGLRLRFRKRQPKPGVDRERHE
jgi:protein-S-isoprenylcysteine O-methyltransferase Ste14